MQPAEQVAEAAVHAEQHAKVEPDIDHPLRVSGDRLAFQQIRGGNVHVAKLDGIDVDALESRQVRRRRALGLMSNDDREEDHGDGDEGVRGVLVLCATDEERNADQRGDRQQDCDRTRARKGVDGVPLAVLDRGAGQVERIDGLVGLRSVPPMTP